MINAAKLAITALVIYLIFRAVDLPRLGETIAGVRLAPCIATCLLYPVGLLISAMRLGWILRGYGLATRLKRTFDLIWIAGFFNNMLPTSIGGDVYRALSLNREFPQKPAQVVSSIILDRGLGLLALLILAIFTSPFYLRTVLPAVNVDLIVQGTCAFMSIVALWLLFSGHRLRLTYRSRYDLVNKLVNGINVLITYPDKRMVAYGLVVSFIFALLAVLAQYFLFLAFGHTISFTLLMFVIPVVSLAGIIPLSLNALGITEGVGMYLLVHLGVEAEVALSVLLTGRVLQVLCSSTGGLPLLLRQGLLSWPKPR
jgi:glycosyltransferase 2 family protein